MNYKAPILELGKTLITSILIDLTDEQALQFQKDIVMVIKSKSANGVVIDISALDVVDSFMARVINDTAKSARLVGAEVVVCGIQPYVAITLIEMGRNLFEVGTTFNLEQAINQIKQRIEQRA
jgi:rsbT antagonist protein RsbS